MERRLIRPAVVIGMLVLLVAAVAVIVYPRDEGSAPADASEAPAPQAGGNPSGAGGGRGLDGSWPSAAAASSTCAAAEPARRRSSWSAATTTRATPTHTPRRTSPRSRARACTTTPILGRAGRRPDRGASTIWWAIWSACWTPPGSPAPTSSSHAGRLVARGAAQALAGPLPAARLLRHLREQDALHRRGGDPRPARRARRHARRRPGRLLHQLAGARRRSRPAVGDVPPHRAARDPRARLRRRPAPGGRGLSMGGLGARSTPPARRAASALPRRSPAC